ncbi:cyclodeaminase/cyclohydrolase family protein [Capillimicrobium parvum]|uniref:Cyclodeaminase/cyclohydrolase domain-containing protein n=1 Tax=Capillimicrobium parvum TaxID=2884022 RepID=A0A9E7BYC1_9ACTN|nr:cyclodeaminase/cyclohydrolase family protein [Capillimicrobium parvum]UGS34305.1 hypothetical protein DSM104329_00681 [Capillimicrobium parvum]
MGSEQHTFGELLEELAAPTPSPAAGTACAWALALAAGLVELSAGVTLARADLAGVHPRMEEIVARVRARRAEALELGDADRSSFGPVLEAQRLAADDPARPQRLADALSGAAETPLALARAAAEVADLAAEAARTGNRAATGDAAAAGLLARAAGTAAARIVLINLARQRDDPRVDEARALADR